MESKHRAPTERRIGLSKSSTTKPLLSTIHNRTTVNGIARKSKFNNNVRGSDTTKAVTKDSDSDDEKPSFQKPANLEEADILAAPLSSDIDDDLPQVACRRDSSEPESPICDIRQSGFGKARATKSGAEAETSRHFASTTTRNSTGVGRRDAQSAAKSPATTAGSSATRNGALSNLMNPKKRPIKKTYSSQSSQKSKPGSSYDNPIDNRKTSRNQKSVRGSRTGPDFSGDEDERGFKLPPLLSDEESPPKKLRLDRFDEALKAVDDRDISPVRDVFRKPADIDEAFIAGKASCKKPFDFSAADISFESSFSSAITPDDLRALESSHKRHPQEDMLDAQPFGFRIPPEYSQSASLTEALGCEDAHLASSGREALHSLDINALPESEDDELLSAKPVSTCPICGKVVSSELLRNFTGGKDMSVAKQAAFCRHHNAHSAASAYSASGYPTIDWDRLDARIKAHHSYIQSILINKVQSHYRATLEERVRTGKASRTLQQALFSKNKTSIANAEQVQGLIPGYYGSRGLRAISENLMEKFHVKLHKMATTDKLIMKRGQAGYVQEVLVPEIAVKLICEDLGIKPDAAREVMRESSSMGEAVNEEIVDVVVPRDDETDDEDDLAFGYD